MHADQVATSVDLVRNLIATQFPRFSQLSITPVASWGTDHDIYRIGGELVVRLPIVGWAVEQAYKEAEWLPLLAPHLPLVVPEQVAIGRPEHGYPYAWSISKWLPGVDASHGLDDHDAAASDLAGFIKALRGNETVGAPHHRHRCRGGPLLQFDEDVRRSIDELGDRVDRTGVLRCWQQAREVGSWDGTQVWVHGDLLPGNLLVKDGRLSAVIDFGGLNVGDPACDLQPAWNVFVGRPRRRFLTALDVDEEAWLRGRGWVVFQTVSALAYYWESNPGIVRQAEWALREAIKDDAPP